MHFDRAQFLPLNAAASGSALPGPRRAKIVHVGGHQLVALRKTNQQHRFQVGAHRVDRGGVTRRAGAVGQQLAMGEVCRHFQPLVTSRE